MRAAPSARQIGERRHEQCRFGTLTEAYSIDAITGREQPMVIPLCTFDPPGPVPPALNRAWGGSIEVERDCAVCPAYQRLEAEVLHKGEV